MSAAEAAISPLAVLTGDPADRQPIRLGPFLVGTDGLLRLVSPDRPATFSVLWRGRVVQASLETAGSGAALAIEAALGRVPSTASCGDGGVLREQAFGLVRDLPPHLPPAWRVRLMPGHRIGVGARIGLAIPVGASELVAGVTSFLLGLGAYFELLEEAGAGFAASSAEGAGTANTCPG